MLLAKNGQPDVKGAKKYLKHLDKHFGFCVETNEYHFEQTYAEFLNTLFNKNNLEIGLNGNVTDKPFYPVVEIMDPTKNKDPWYEKTIGIPINFNKKEWTQMCEFGKAWKDSDIKNFKTYFNKIINTLKNGLPEQSQISPKVHEYICKNLKQAKADHDFYINLIGKKVKEKNKNYKKACSKKQDKNIQINKEIYKSL